MIVKNYRLRWSIDPEKSHRMSSKHPFARSGYLRVSPGLEERSRQRRYLTANPRPLFFLGALKDLYVPFCSMHTNSLPILNQLGSIFYPDDRWQAIFTSDDCSMGHQSTNFGHQAFDGYKQRCPARVRKGGDQDVAT